MSEGDIPNSRAQQELRVLYQISQAMAHGVELAGVLNAVLDILEAEMGMSRGTLTLRRPDSDVFETKVSHSLSDSEMAKGQYKEGEGVTGRVASTGEAAVVPNIADEPEFLNRTGVRGGESLAFICVPIIHQRQVIGTMSVDRPTGPAEDIDRDVKFLKLVADLLAEAVSRIRERIAERDALVAENRRLKQELGERYRPANMVGNCSSMRAMFRQIAQVADSAATVLIRGESGTGKELVARAIHYNSPRAEGAFVAVNCAALPENLIETELFGHEKGAFTGAAERRKGRFELAHGGTLFLDEIGDITPRVQIRLLRVLQERMFERVGGTQTVQVDVRVITATSRDLEKLMSDESFREDLYYRLNVFPIHTPPLRERRSDIPLLADHFVQKYSELHGRTIKRISSAAINMMMMYHWPGNVRELENCVERAVLTSTDAVIHSTNLPPSLQTSQETDTPLLPDRDADLKTMVQSYEREIIVDALKESRGNAAAAARALNTTSRILNYRIKQLHIQPDRYAG